MFRNRYFSNNYDVQIKNLVRLILRMKVYVSKILQITSSILQNYDEEKRTKVFELAEKTKTNTLELEDSVNKIIALSHPVAFDLRFLLCSIKLCSELNYIANWCKKTVNTIKGFENKELVEINKKDLIEMLDISFNTLKDVISVLLQYDSKQKADAEILSKIDAMLKVDNAVDLIYEKILQDGLHIIRQRDVDPIVIFDAIGMAKNIEKISDCIHNMIVTTRYILTGKRTYN